MKKITLPLLLLTIALYSCKNNATSEDHFNEQKEIVNEEQGMDGHTSINSLDWQGTYEGTLPCEDCDGIFTEITLGNDESFTVNSTRLAGSAKEKSTQKGLYQWDETGSIVSMKIDGVPSKFKVGENRLIMMNDEGKIIERMADTNYILIKKVK